MDVPETIVFDADPHAGSTDGLMAPAGADKIDRRLNDAQKYLWECREWCVHWMPKNPDLLVLLGDEIEGQQPKSKHTGLVTADVGEQVIIAEENVRPLMDRAKTFLRVDGTPYHQGAQKELRALDNFYKHKHWKSAQDHFLDLGNGVMHISHDPGTRNAIYLGTVVDRNLRFATIAEVTDNLPEERFIVRAHLHTYIHLEVAWNKAMVLAPCWKLQDAHAKTKGFYRWRPTIGMMVFEKDERMDLGYVVRCAKFKSPKPEVLSYGRRKNDAKTVAVAEAGTGRRNLGKSRGQRRKAAGKKAGRK